MADNVTRHLGQLRAAGTDRAAFDEAHKNMQAAGLSAADTAAIANQYGDTVTKYKSKADSHQDINRAFIRNARFMNKIKDD